jgi:hypothetical protein
LNLGTISESDGQLITSFVVEKLAKGKIFEKRAARIATMLVQWHRFVSLPYDELTLDSLLIGLRAFQTGKNSYGGVYSQSTKRSMIKTIKIFVRY